MRAAILATLIVVLAAAAFAFRIRYEMVDFEVNRTAGARVLEGEPLYRASDGHYQFKYFPASAFLFAPFALLPSAAARAVWFALSAGMLVALIALSLRQLPVRIVPASIVVTLTVLTLGKFYAHELTLGQANLPFGVVAIAALARLRQGRSIGAGAMFGASAVVKPYGLLFLPYLLATRRIRAAAACAAVLAAAAALPLFVYGTTGTIDLFEAWGNTVIASTPQNLTNQDNVSIAAMYAKWLGSGRVAQWLTVVTSVSLLGLCGAIVAMRRPGLPSEYLEVALLLTAIPLLSPQGWDYVLLLSTPAVMLLVNALPRLGRPLQVVTLACCALIGLSIYDVMGRAAYARFMALSVVTVAYGVLIGMVAYLRVAQRQ